jgi:hypothetical protein
MASLEKVGNKVVGDSDEIVLRRVLIPVAQ